MPARLDVQTAHRGRLLALQVVSWTDAQGRTVRREVVRHPGAVLIVPELDGDRLVLLRNHRVAVGETLWELPAGTLEPGEPPGAAAARELEEETGYRAARIVPMGEFFTSPGFCDELMRVFLAQDLAWVGERHEPHEEIEARAVPFAEALAMVDDGRIRDGKSIAAILMRARSRGGAA
jgi:ADP-ribose pyrophosphatase